MNKDVVLIGGFHEIVELCEDSGLNIVGIIDNNKVDEFMGYSIIGTDLDAIALFLKFGKYPLLVTPDLPLVRKKLCDYYYAIGYKFTTIISRDARVSKSSRLGMGTIVQHGVSISSSSTIGNFVKLNTCSNLMHDCSIGDYSTIAPNAVVLGRVTIQNLCYIGSNSTILPNIEIKQSSIIGAGAVVTKNTDEGITVVGVPARKLVK